MPKKAMTSISVVSHQPPTKKQAFQIDAPANRVYSFPAAGQILDCSASTVRREVNARRLGSVRIGRRVGVTQQQINDFLATVSINAIDADSIARKCWGEI